MGNASRSVEGYDDEWLTGGSIGLDFSALHFSRVHDVKFVSLATGDESAKPRDGRGISDVAPLDDDALADLVRGGSGLVLG